MPDSMSVRRAGTYLFGYKVPKVFNPASSLKAQHIYTPCTNLLYYYMNVYYDYRVSIQLSSSTIELYMNEFP